MSGRLELGGDDVQLTLNRLAASGFSIGLIAPLIAIMIASATPVVASSNDCNVDLNSGVDWESQAHKKNLDDEGFWFFEQNRDDNQNTELDSLTTDFYADVEIPRDDGSAIEMELVTGYSYTFCIEFHPSVQNTPNMSSKGDVYLLSSSNWAQYRGEYWQYKDGWGITSEDLNWVPVEWRDMAVFLPFRDTHAYENKQSVSFSTALDNDNYGWISWFGEQDDASYFLVFDNWNNSRHADADGVDGDMIVQVWVDVEERLTLPKFTAYLIVGILPISCIVIPLMFHSKYHSHGKTIEEEEVQMVPLLETAPENKENID